MLYAGPTPATKTIRGSNTGTISAPGVITVTFTSYERVECTTANDVIDVPSIPGGQDGTANTLTVQLDATGVFLQVFF